MYLACGEMCKSALQERSKRKSPIRYLPGKGRHRRGLVEQEVFMYRPSFSLQKYLLEW
jgi:hypothetical protein